MQTCLLYTQSKVKANDAETKTLFRKGFINGIIIDIWQNFFPL